jgi:hypothetical protein
MKLIHVWSVLCRRSVVDSETNNLSLYDVLEQLAIELKPSQPGLEAPKNFNIPMEFEVTSLWTKGDERPVLADIQIEQVSPSGKVISTINQKIAIPQGNKRLRTRNKVVGLNVESAGNYVFRVSVKEEDSKEFRVVSEIPLAIETKISEHPGLKPQV